MILTYPLPPPLYIPPRWGDGIKPLQSILTARFCVPVRKMEHRCQEIADSAKVVNRFIHTSTPPQNDRSSLSATLHCTTFAQCLRKVKN